MAKNKQKSASPDPATNLPRILAIRSDVREHLDDWKTDRVKGKFAAKLELIFRSLKSGKIAMAEMTLGQVVRCSVAEADGNLRELGPNQKGGAPRVFLLLRHRNFYFLAADVEEGNSGCRIIPTAKDRSATICSKPAPRSTHDIKSMLGSAYEITEILEDTSRRT